MRRRKVGETLKVHVLFIISGKKARSKTIKLKKGATGLELLNSLNHAPDAFVLLRNDKTMPINETLQDDDKIRLLNVVSGG